MQWNFHYSSARNEFIQVGTIHTIVISHSTAWNMHLCLGHEGFYYDSHCHAILIDTLYIYKLIHYTRIAKV